LRLLLWLRASGHERLNAWARLLLLIVVEIVLVILLLTVVGSVVIPFFAPSVVAATPTPVP
jgi:hypothetical protein